MNILLVIVTLLLEQVIGMHNITIDDTDPSIVYSGVWDPTSDTQNSLAYGGAHHVSFEPDATATWQFTGQSEYPALKTC